MDKFDNIIKQKIEQLEVPFDDAHWVEMEATLNRIQSKKRRNLLLGSATIISTIAIAGFFLFPNSTTIQLNSTNQNHTQATSENSKSIVNQSISSKKERISNNIIVKEDLSKSLSKEGIISKEKIATNSPEENIKEKKPIPAITLLQGKEIISKEIKKQTIVPDNIILGKLTVKDKQIEKISTNKTNTPTIVKAKPIVSETVSVHRIKNVRHKIYEDENVSKKNIKRNRKSFLSFFSFKKRIYKVPLSKKRSSKRKE